METLTNNQTLRQSRVSRIIQIHPTLNCNLACKHCYSSSSPGVKKELDVNSINNIIEQAAHIGYNVISMSGGEPFLYKPLEELIAYSKSLGYFNSVTTNGMLLNTERAKRIIKNLDLIAISVDGKEEFHDTMRSQKGAFKKMLEGVEIVKNSIEKYGFIHTLLPENWELLPWLTEFALAHKASLLHLHPLEMSGRANESFNGLKFTATDLYKIYIAHHFLKTHYEKEIYLQLDLLHKDNFVDNPNFVFHQSFKPELTAQSFSSIFKELIIDEKGDILPIAHGCSKFFRIGNIHTKAKLTEMIEYFMEEKFEYVVDLYNLTYQEIMNDNEYEIFNWSEHVIEKSHQMFSKIISHQLSAYEKIA
ncbi:MAG: radical SAM protein [Chitinophagaceae bacterium]